MFKRNFGVSSLKMVTAPKHIEVEY